jgi:hypothetical protein
MLSTVFSALQHAESRFSRFINAVSMRTGLTQQQLLQIWDEPESSTPSIDPGLSLCQPKAEPPKAEPPKAEPPKAEPPKAEPPKVEPPKAEPPKVEPPKVEPPKAEPPKVEPPKAREEFVIEEEEFSMEEEVQTKPGRCRHIMVSGKSKGSPCGAPAKENGFCNKHKSSAPQVKEHPKVEQVQPQVKEVIKEPMIKEQAVRQKTPPKSVEQAPEEFIKLTNRLEEKKIEFRVMTREILLDQKVYPPIPTKALKSYLVVENTRVVVDAQKTNVLGYLNDSDELVREPIPATDKVVLDYGIPFDASHISDSDIDE